MFKYTPSKKEMKGSKHIYIYIYLQGFLLRVETRMVFYIDIFSGPGHHGLEDVSIKKASGPIG